MDNAERGLRTVTMDNAERVCELPGVTDETRGFYKARRSVVMNKCETVWPSGKATDWKADDVGSIPRFGSPFSSKVVVCGHRLLIWPLAINEILFKSGSHYCPSSCRIILAVTV